MGKTVFFKPKIYRFKFIIPLSKYFYDITLTDRRGNNFTVGHSDIYLKELQIPTKKVYQYLKEQGFNVYMKNDGYNCPYLRLKIKDKSDQAKFDLINIGLFEVAYDPEDVIPETFKIT
jgi:hypothetical protein